MARLSRSETSSTSSTWTSGGKVAKSTVRVKRVQTLAQALELQPNAVAHAATEADKVFRARESSIFSSEGAASGHIWPALSKDYEKWKNKHYPGRKILQLHGSLRKAATEQNDPDHIVDYFKVGKWSIRLGVRGPLHWRWHNDGGYVEGRPPRRHWIADDRESLMAMRARVSLTLQPYVKRQLTIILRSGVI